MTPFQDQICDNQQELTQRVRVMKPTELMRMPEVLSEPDNVGDVPIPAYLSDTYTWAYLKPSSIKIFDHNWVVDTILWGNNRRLQKTVFESLEPATKVLLASDVYGDLAIRLAEFIGPEGHLDIVDVSPVQVENCRKKLKNVDHVNVRQDDLAYLKNCQYDAIVCFFLLHEIPDDYKHRVVAALLENLAPGGKVVFVDYHKPGPWHPIKGIISLVFDTLEPFAKSLWSSEIRDFAADADLYRWHKETCFGGLYQKVVVERQ